MRRTIEHVDRIRELWRLSCLAVDERLGVEADWGGVVMVFSAAVTAQRMSALQKANSIRLDRAALKRRIKLGEIDVPWVLETMPAEAESMTIMELLRSKQRWGRKKAQRLCTRFAISETRRLDRLTERQRAALIAELRAIEERRVKQAAYREARS